MYFTFYIASFTRSPCFPRSTAPVSAPRCTGARPPRPRRTEGHVWALEMSLERFVYFLKYAGTATRTPKLYQKFKFSYCHWMPSKKLRISAQNLHTSCKNMPKFYLVCSESQTKYSRSRLPSPIQRGILPRTANSKRKFRTGRQN